MLYYIVHSGSFEFCIFLLLFIIACCVYAIFEMRKGNPGHPMIWAFPFCILDSVLMILYKCSSELTNNIIFQKATNIMAITGEVLFYISCVVTFIIAHKKGYTNKKKAEGLLPATIFCVIMAIIIFVSLKFF